MKGKLPKLGLQISRSRIISGIIFLVLLLLTVSYLNLSEFPSGNHLFLKTEVIRLKDITSESGIESYTRASIYEANPSYIEVMGGGVSVGDINGDKWEDIFFVSMPSFDPEPEETASLSALYKNLGDGTFQEFTAEAGLDAIKGFPMGGLFFDFDNNGTQDLYIASYQGGQLFRNEGGYFTDVTDSAGVSLEGLCGNYSCLAAAASAADYNRDGHLDLLVVNNVNWDIENPAHYGDGSLIPSAYKGQPSILFENNGDGTFKNVSEESGLTNYDLQGYRENGKGLSAVWSDFNNDSWPDVYIANDMSPSRLYLNNREGSFLEIGKGNQVDELKSSMGIDAADYDYNGNVDLVTTNLKPIMTSFFRNYGNLRFDYATFYTGIMPSARSSGWGIVFSDLDLDGFQDMVMASGPIWDHPDEAENLFFRNMGDGKFEDVTQNVVNFSNNQITRGLAITDLDQSGTPDLIFSNINGEPSQLLKNESNGNNWIRIDLEGVVSNRDAVGTRVILEREDGLIQNQIVVAGNSYLSSGSKSLFFGLAKSKIKQLTIQWPSGRTDTLNSLKVNEIIHVREGLNPDRSLTVTTKKPESI